MKSEIYNIIDSHTGVCAGQAAGLKRASRKAETMNQEYGAVRYSYRLAVDRKKTLQNERAQQRAESGYAQ